MEFSTEFGSFCVIMLFCASALVTWIQESAKNKRDAAYQGSRERHAEFIRCAKTLFVQRELMRAEAEERESAESVELTHLNVEEPVAPSTSRTIIDECVLLLVSMGHKKSDAKKRVNSLGGHKFDTTEEMLTAALSR